MHGFTRVTLKDHPEIKALVLAADHTYRKHEAVIKVETHVTLSGTYWDGGTRSTYTAVDLATHRSQGAPHYNPPQFGGPTASPEVALPIGTVIVETGMAQTYWSRLLRRTHKMHLNKDLGDGQLLSSLVCDGPGMAIPAGD